MTRWSFEPQAEPKQTVVVTLKNGQQAKAILHRTTVDSVAYVGDCILSKSINGRIEYWEPKTEKVFFVFQLSGSRSHLLLTGHQKLLPERGHRQ